MDARKIIFSPQHRIEKPGHYWTAVKFSIMRRFMGQSTAGRELILPTVFPLCSVNESL